MSDSSLLTARNIRAMCLIEEKQIRIHSSFTESCVRTTHSRRCCRSWSLGNYVAVLTNRSSCRDISKANVKQVLELLGSCHRYYHNLYLTADCYESSYENDRINKCNRVPVQCKHYNAVYHILHYLTDVHFLPKTTDDVTPSTHLTMAMTFLPIAAGSAVGPLYKDMEGESLSRGNVNIIAINFGIKHDLFSYYLMSDTVWFGVALAVIVCLMWAYTSSLFITVMAIVSIFLSLFISYFLYTMVFAIKFYPFMNLLTIVILIGIGADDVFIYCKVWNLAKFEKNVGTLEKIISDTLKHATLSMFVTSFTTGAAFYANYVSDITALDCFAIYAGTTIIINFLMMITWIPAMIVVYEKWCSDCLVCYSPDIYTPKRGCCFYFCKIPYKAYYLISDWARIFFEKILPCIVVKPRFFWIFLYSSLSICGILFVFYAPRLKLPSSNEFQLFSMDHPFEVYDFKVKDEFWFEKAAGSNLATMPLTVVWGVKPVDNGDHLDPFSEGTLVYDGAFNVATPAAQKWLVEFCANLRRTPMYQLSPGLQLTNCFIEQFKLFMERDCEGVKERHEPCCRSSKFPFSEDVFTECLQIYRPFLDQTQERYFSNNYAGLRYAKESDKHVALIVEFNSKQPFSFNHTSMQEFYNRMNNWVTDQMLRAPPEMRGGWFISHLAFYDLQETIVQGTPVAIGVSLAVATVVAFATTLNLLISLYAMLSIAGAIFVTIGSLVLLGWQLNILESVILTIVIGLSMDFTLHYGMAYRLSPDLDREMRVCCSLSRMGSPVAMAALTSFLAGGLMMPSTILAYRQLGTFLMLSMSISWVYATFFFQSLLRTIGPQGGFGQFHWPACDCCSGSQKEHVDKTVYAMSESTLSSSSTNHANSSETHELEPLTDRDIHGHRHKGHHAKVPPRLANNNTTLLDCDTGTKRDTLVTIQCQNNQRPRVVTAHPYHSTNNHDCVNVNDEVTTQKLLNNDPEDSDPSDVMSHSANHNAGEEIWLKRVELV